MSENLAKKTRGTVNHDARRQQIVAESLKLFATFGYTKVHGGMIAQKCHFSRTILYTYFKDKREIFLHAIREVTQQIRASYEVFANASLSTEEKLRQVGKTVLSVLSVNHDFLCVIVDVLTKYRRTSGIPVEKVEQHLSALRNAIQKGILAGVSNGEFSTSLNVNAIVNAIFSHFEAFALRETVTGNADLDVAVSAINESLKLLRA